MPRPSGTFTRRPRPGIEPPAGLLFTNEWHEGDFDGDGSLDVVTGVMDQAFQRLDMLLFLNNGSGHYRNAGSASFGDCDVGCVRLSYEDLPPEFFERGYLEGIAGGLEGLLKFCQLPGESLIRMRDQNGGRLQVDVSWTEH